MDQFSLYVLYALHRVLPTAFCMYEHRTNYDHRICLWNSLRYLFTSIWEGNIFYIRKSFFHFPLQPKQNLAILRWLMYFKSSPANEHRTVYRCKRSPPPEEIIKFLSFISLNLNKTCVFCSFWGGFRSCPLPPTIVSEALLVYDQWSVTMLVGRNLLSKRKFVMEWKMDFYDLIAALMVQRSPATPEENIWLFSR